MFNTDDRYKIDEVEFQKKSNELGNQGWKLVSCVLTAVFNGRTRGYLSIFKRKIQ